MLYAFLLFNPAFEVIFPVQVPADPALGAGRHDGGTVRASAALGHVVLDEAPRIIRFLFLRPSRHMYIGFSIGGVEWLGHDLIGAASQAEREDRLRHVGFEEARLTHAMGGNLLRVFYYVRSILSPFANGDRLDYSSLPWAYQTPWYALTEEQKLEACDRALEFMTCYREALEGGTPDGSPLALAELDAYLDGAASYGAICRRRRCRCS